jgi:hypothetical protein
MSRFKFSKYRKGDKVNSPSGEGTVDAIQYMDGKHWYELKEIKGFFREDELTRTQRAAK